MPKSKDTLTVHGRDIPNMSPGERQALGNMARMGKLKFEGTAVVRDANGNARYDDPSRKGQYHEDKL